MRKKCNPIFSEMGLKKELLIWSRPVDRLMGEHHPSLEPVIFIKYSTKNLTESEKRKLLRSFYLSKKVNIVNNIHNSW